MRKLFLGGVALAALVSATAVANAQSPGPPVVLANGLYFSVDGGWERVKLPDYALGIRNNTGGFVPPNDRGIASPFTQRFDGYNIRGTVGYMIGANMRVEVGARYVHASKTQDTAFALTRGAATVSFLDGTAPASLIPFCGTALTACNLASTQSTNYSNWQINGKFAADARFGASTLTPSVAIFGGHARARQSLAQSFTQFFPLGVVNFTGTYNASTALGWTDLGVRFGMNADVDVNPWLTVGLGGFAGIARRHASLTGSDVGTDTSAGFNAFEGTSAISTSANVNAFVGNVETHATVKWAQAVAFRAFVGLNYDSAVPGVSTPGWNPFGASIPAGITFQGLTSYYAGGGVIVKF